MQCTKCNEEKLSQEFPAALTEECTHAVAWCLKCCIAHLSNPPACHECKVSFTKADIDFLYSSYAVITQKDKFAIYNTAQIPPSSSSSSTLVVTQLNGEHHKISCNASTQIINLTHQLAMLTGISASHQQLIYNKTPLQPYKNGKAMTLGDYNVSAGSILQLMHLLYAVSGPLDEIVFDLYWGYPIRGVDYLDATCLGYSGSKNQFIVDYSHAEPSGIVKHSGDLMDHNAKIGHHIINVSLTQVPSHITHVFFVLSAYDCKDISFFPNPSVKLFDKANASVELCKGYSIKSIGHSQAVVMCYLTRQSGAWRVYVIDKHSDGNAKDYNPITETISGLFASSAVL